MKHLTTIVLSITATAGLMVAGPAHSQGDPTGGMGIGTNSGTTGRDNPTGSAGSDYGAGARGGMGGNAGDIPDTGGPVGSTQGQSSGGGRYGEGAVGGMGGGAGDIPRSGTATTGGGAGGAGTGSGTGGFGVDPTPGMQREGASGAAATQPIREFQWGWFGLFGMLGLLGLRRREEAAEEPVTQRERRAA